MGARSVGHDDVADLDIMEAIGTSRMAPTFTHPDLSGTRLRRALGSWGLQLSDPVVTTRTVLDTFDGRLHSAGLRLEQVDVPQVALVLRTIATGSAARLAWPYAPTWPSELPAGSFRDRIEVTRERALLPLAQVRSSVTSGRRLDRRQETTLLVELHEQLAVDGAEVGAAPAWALEIHPISGHADEVARLSERLHGLGCEVADGDVLELAARAAGIALEGHESSPTVPLEPRQGALGAYRQVLTNLAATVTANLDGTVAAIDPEFLHELRVAVRRTRTVLSQGKGVLPAPIRDRYREGFGWLGEVTGPPRDLDVFLAGWEGYVSSLAPADVALLERVRSELDVRRSAAHRTLADALRSEEAREILEGWQRWLSDPEVTDASGQHVGPVVAARIRKAQDKVLVDGRAIDVDSHPERLHDLRKDTKKLRYLLECFGSLFPAKPRKKFVGQLKALQENLGVHQDAAVHLAQLRDLAHDLRAMPGIDADVLLAVGRLRDRLDHRRLEERADFATRFAAYDTKDNRRALEKLLRPLDRA